MTDQEQKRIFAKNLNTLLDKTQKTQKEVANAIGVLPSTFNTWATGHALPRMGKVQKLADYFGVKKSALIEEQSANSLPTNIRPVGRQSLPVLGQVACGQPIFINQEYTFNIEEGEEIDADYILIASGDSMTGARIQDGDLVFIRQQDTVENGQIAAVSIDDEVTLKRVYYYPEKNMLILKAENTKYEDMIYNGEELDHIRIQGLAVAFQSLVE